MRKRRNVTHSCLMLFFMLVVATTTVSVATANTEHDGAKPTQQKKFPLPHMLHMKLTAKDLAEFTVADVKDWPGLIRSLQIVPPVFDFDEAMDVLLRILPPGEPTGDDRREIVNGLNQVMNERAGADGAKGERFKQNKWDARAQIIRTLPQISGKKRMPQLGKITCNTCHETESGISGEPGQPAKLTEKDKGKVLACFAEAVADKKSYVECQQLADSLKNSELISEYGPLRNFIQRQRKEAELPFFTAIHPADPYTFKPLLRRLVCIECHGAARKVAQISDADGKVIEPPIFYGVGSEVHKAHKESTEVEGHKE